MAANGLMCISLELSESDGDTPNRFMNLKNLSKFNFAENQEAKSTLPLPMYKFVFPVGIFIELTHAIVGSHPF